MIYIAWNLYHLISLYKIHLAWPTKFYISWSNVSFSTTSFIIIPSNRYTQDTGLSLSGKAFPSFSYFAHLMVSLHIFLLPQNFAQPPLSQDSNCVGSSGRPSLFPNPSISVLAHHDFLAQSSIYSFTASIECSAHYLSPYPTPQNALSLRVKGFVSTECVAYNMYAGNISWVTEWYFAA